ncbi:MAG TPA: class I SAM-dependent methyltransferase [Tepidisphaeraceae bacterium]|jgi:SAM-dependent methyltransferase|nr:class I SAM-dependent methyltransferase [Tepidisphaeraceae bacterium]
MIAVPVAPRPQTPPASIRRAYETHGVDGFYRRSGGDYRNPHEPQLRESLQIAARGWDLNLKHVLDLAAGSGEVTLALQELGATAIDAIDPFTFEAYRRRTGNVAGRQTFQDIAASTLAGRHYSLIVCSFAMHLVERSRLPGLCAALSEIGDALLILTPHKRPEIRESWGWTLTREMVVQRVRSRLYRPTPILSPSTSEE